MPQVRPPTSSRRAGTRAWWCPTAGRHPRRRIGRGARVGTAVADNDGATLGVEGQRQADGGGAARATGTHGAGASEAAADHRHA